MADPSSAVLLACPQCHAPISPTDADCGVCGANITLYSLLAEREWQGRLGGSREAPRPISTEQLVPRLGDYLLRHDYITPDDLQAALERQTAGGETRPRLGQTLVDMGRLSREALDQAIAEQVVELQAALVESNRLLEARVAERTRELENALARLSEFNQLKANFVANVSHELRTPLAKIKGYTSLLADETLGPLVQEQRDAMRVVGQACDQLEQLINDLISYAQAARGELSLRLTPVSPALLIAQALERTAVRASRKKLDLTGEVRPDLPPVVGDEHKLLWVLLQLLDNAVKFTAEGGQVTVGAWREAGLVRLEVKDSGIGIPLERQAEIFEPFQQLDGSPTRRYGGTGLGLTLARKIVEAHGTEFQVESQEGAGSRFSFSLPVFRQEQA